MMTDRELLALAAKAAGIELWWRGGMAICNATGYWNPLIDDGDALRLAVKCKLYVFTYGDNATSAACIVPPNDGVGLCQPVERGDWEASTRRAIVNAAAEIGKAMP
jgi:hypothetical protein